MSQQILAQANSLARSFYDELGFYSEFSIIFHKSTNSDRKKCWDMSVLAHKELLGVDPNKSIPRLDPFAVFADRVNKAAKDGKISSKHG